MNPVVHKDQSLAIIYDASRMDVPAAETFTPGYWAAHSALQGEAIGRGSAWFIDAPFGPVVLRQYLRGGWAAKLSHSHYFFTTVENLYFGYEKQAIKGTNDGSETGLFDYIESTVGTVYEFAGLESKGYTMQNGDLDETNFIAAIMDVLRNGKYILEV